MQALATDTQAPVGYEPEVHARVWIDLPDGSIARGTVIAFSRDGALVRIVGATPVMAGIDVAMRIAFLRSSRTLGAQARVQRLRAGAESTDCEVEWTHAGPERDQLATLTASLS